MSHVFRYLVEAPPAEGEEIALSAEDSHHALRVVRRQVGDAIELMDGRGGIWTGTIAAAGEGALVRVGRRRPAPPVPDVTLHVGTMEWGRLDMLVEKAAELGVPRIVPFASERSRRVPDAGAFERRRERFRRIAAAAARQAGHGSLTEVRGLVPFETVISEIPSGEGLLLDRAGDESFRGALDRRLGASLLIGPDAGFAPGELAAARAAGHRVCCLGDATLRAETAALVAVSLALDAAGHLGSGRAR